MEILDTCDCPREHNLFSEHNKKVLGEMKDETNKQPIEEFIGLKAKMCAFKLGNTSKRVAKGVSRVVIRDDISWENYYNCLFNDDDGIICCEASNGILTRALMDSNRAKKSERSHYSTSLGCS